MYSLSNADVSLLLGVLLCSIGVTYLYSQTHKLRHIPTVGSSLPILSHFVAYRFLYHAPEVIAEGARKYPNGIFKIPDLLDWKVVVNEPKLIAEYRKVPEHIFSSRTALESGFQQEYTFHPLVINTPRYHISIMKSQLTRSIAKLTFEIHDEVLAAFDDYFPNNMGGEWEQVPVFGIMTKIACRASNRVFVGLPLCRDPEFVALSVKRTGDVVKTSRFLTLFPKFLRRFIAPFISVHRKQLETVQRLLAPIIEACRQEIAEKEEQATDQGSNFLAWLLRDPFGKNSSDLDLTCRVLLLNFASIHTTSMTITQVLYDLVVHPEYVEPLREEVARLVECHGWTKAAIEKMDKINSFIKESMRLNTISELLMLRITTEDYTFVETGTFIPRGTSICVATHDAHFDGDTYEDPTRFDGFRFVKLRNGQTMDNEKHFDMTTTSPEYLGFGTGVHACPGRFFAAHEIKLLLAHMVLNYDIKTENRGVRPPNRRYKAACAPDPTIKLLFRKRTN